MYRREFVTNIYDADVMLIVSSPAVCRDLLIRRYPSFDRLPSDSDWLGSVGKVIECESDDHKFTEWLLWLPEWVSDQRHVVTLGHECLHLTCQILRHRGVRLVGESEEAFTYLWGALFRELWKALDQFAARQRSRR